jgi:hypothetical protein
MVAQLNREPQNLEQKKLYDTDYNLWVIETVKQLKNRDFDSLDWDNLIEEVSDLSKRDKRKVQSLLIKLFEHLLKLKYWQSEYQYSKGHWEAEIVNFRQQISIELEDSPSLKSYIAQIFEDCYQKGRVIVSKRSQLPLHTFPENPIANLEQILDENWLP